MIYGQRDARWNNVELGIGVGASIGQYGCALTDVASLLYNCFNKQVTPLILNQQLSSLQNHQGYAYNGAGDYDLLNWNAIEVIYRDITLAFNNLYPNDPADMGLIDAQLSKGFSVVVGVSFLHNPKATNPTHYVEIYRKNIDATYQCRDPWYADDTSFNARYAVNKMSVANAILQAVSYNGTPQLPLSDILKAVKQEIGSMDSDTIKVIKVRDLVATV